MPKLICSDPLQMELFEVPSRGQRGDNLTYRITAKGKVLYDIPRGYAAPPGSGPAGETCRSCAHRRILNTYGHNWHKCGLLEHRWTRGPGTDIRLKSPACLHWAPKPTPQP
jgi:hypothetical protein